MSELSYSPFERLSIGRPVHRIDYIVSRARAKRVLDLGALDETELVKNQDLSWRWLHGEIAKVASATLGIDNSEKTHAPSSDLPSSQIDIRHGSVEMLDEFVKDFKPDLIIAGELIEHTSNTLGWLRALAQIAPGREIILTTPNATSLINLALAFLGRENCHQDHLQIYSYKTISTLADRVRISPRTILPYYYDPHQFFGRLGARHNNLVRCIESGLLRPVQYCFPLTAFGLILDGVLCRSEQ